MKVFKFGGASVKDAQAVRNVANLISEYQNEKLLIVISAMGKTTNQIENLIQAYWDNNQTLKQTLIQELKDFHFKIAEELVQDKKNFIFSNIEDLFMELECLIEKRYPNTSYDEIYDGIIGYGELISTKIVSDYMQNQGIKNKWIDARNFIQTDNNFREARVKWQETEETIQRILSPYIERSIVITQGFIGSDEKNNATTLGREGSDYTAAIFAYCLNAKDVTIWKDVAGIMNADPKLFPDAVKLDALNFNQAIELAYYGASVIHPKTIQPLKNKNISLYVNSFINTSDKGTMVSAQAAPIQEECYIVKNNQTILSISTKNFSFITEDHLHFIFQAFAEFKVRINVMQNSAISFSACCDTKEDKITQLVQKLKEHYTVDINENCVLLTTYNANKTQQLPAFLCGKPILLQQELGNTKQVVLG